MSVTYPNAIGSSICTNSRYLFTAFKSRLVPWSLLTACRLGSRQEVLVRYLYFVKPQLVHWTTTYSPYRLAYHGPSWHPTAKGTCRTQKRPAPNPRGSQQGPGKCGFTAVSQGHAQKRKQWVTREARGIPNVSPLGSIFKCQPRHFSTYLTSPYPQVPSTKLVGTRYRY